MWRVKLQLQHTIHWPQNDERLRDFVEPLILTPSSDSTSKAVVALVYSNRRHNSYSAVHCMQSNIFISHFTLSRVMTRVPCTHQCWCLLYTSPMYCPKEAMCHIAMIHWLTEPQTPIHQCTASAWSSTDWSSRCVCVICCAISSLKMTPSRARRSRDRCVRLWGKEELLRHIVSVYRYLSRPA